MTKRSTVRLHRLVPCALNGRDQNWVYKQMKSGVLAVHSVTEPRVTSLDRLINEMWAKMNGDERS